MQATTAGGEDTAMPFGPYEGVEVAAVAAADLQYVRTIVVNRLGPPTLRAEAGRALALAAPARRSELTRALVVGAAVGLVATGIGYSAPAVGAVMGRARSAPAARQVAYAPAATAMTPAAVNPAVEAVSASPPVSSFAPQVALGEPPPPKTALSPTPSAAVAAGTGDSCGSRAEGAINAAAAESEAPPREAAVEFRVVRTKDTGRVTFLNSQDPYAGHFYVAIFPDDYVAFPEPPADFFLGRCVVVRGRIEPYQGVPQIVLRDPDDIRLVGE